ncbi:HET-domain-containing protein [Trematosphaeria pertusa]|uniref:HET-domain-containing protein n=1 Tax=Trematosphaeria pertusa TaxID=390896 RepID=A0A6A6IAM5_9PLEO|nr:HET-domain-containing protein [Trematosphaeria pertusa]KAF2247431.1 HET-domain-containing protein [Trematosphaeria pertusa]
MPNITLSMISKGSVTSKAVREAMRARTELDQAQEKERDASTIYTYTPLESRHTIRLLELHAGSENEPLKGNLRDFDLEEAMFTDALDDAPFPETEREFPQYEALSYVWGSPLFTHALELVDGGGAIPMTANLAEALRRLRRRDGTRLLWADGVCINQNDVKERGHQVKLMGTIYTGAKEVIVWLGPDNNKNAYKTFSFFETDIMVDEPAQIITAFNQLCPVEYDHRSREYGEMLLVKMMVECEWFERLWVVQEVALARCAVAVWGTEEIDFQKISSAIRTCKAVLPEHKLCTANVLDHSSPDIDLLQVLAWARGLKCSDDRDRVYALLGLPTLGLGRSPIEPDYTQSVSDLYYEIACRAMASGGLWTLLCLTDHGSSAEEWPSELPSWIPDWRRPNILSCPSQVGQGQLPSFVDASTRSLHIEGFCLDTVTSVSSPCFQAETDMVDVVSISRFWCSVIEPMLKEDVLSAGTLPLYAFCDAVMSGDNLNWERCSHGLDATLKFYDYCQSSRWAAGMGKSTRTVDKMLRSIRSKVCVVDSGRSGHASIAFSKFLRGRKLFATHKSFIGLGPEALRAGDCVAFLGEVDTPFILRRQGEFYRFIGAAFISQLANGEGFELWKENSGEPQELEIR